MEDYTINYLHFKKSLSESGKTEIWEVRNKDQTLYLGTIGWYGPWRQYCFYPQVDTIFNIGCMKDITIHLEKLMQEHREKKRQNHD